MILRLTLDQPIHGYWDGGKKQVFNWEFDSPVGKDEKGSYVRIGSWEGNHYFHVAVGKTEKLTLSYAKRHLQCNLRKRGIGGKFEYIEEEDRS